jgi:hypothetical protein
MKINKVYLFFTLFSVALVVSTISGDICNILHFSHPIGELVFTIGGILLTTCFGIQTIKIEKS